MAGVTPGTSSNRGTDYPRPQPQRGGAGHNGFPGGRGGHGGGRAGRPAISKKQRSLYSAAWSRRRNLGELVPEWRSRSGYLKKSFRTLQIAATVLRARLFDPPARYAVLRKLTA